MLNEPVTTIGDPSCPYCQGIGFIRKDDDTKQCVCVFVKTLRKRLGEDIALCRPYLHSSPLFVPPKHGGEEPEVDRSGDNLFIKCSWEDFRPHFRLIAQFLLERHSFQWHFRFVTDEQIKTVFVGSEAYAAKPKKKRDEVISFNSLGDLIGESWDLVIIRLGIISYKNVAMPGALKESLRIREVLNKPTWILDDPGKPFEIGHEAYSAELAEYIKIWFDEVDLPRGESNTKRQGAGGTSLYLQPDDHGLALDDDHKSASKPEPKSNPRPSAKLSQPYAMENDPVICREGTKKYKKSRFKGSE